MEIQQLRYFVAVAETGGFGRAARSLNIVQAAVSQHIQRLERELGVRLFDRSTRHVRLTTAGTRLLPEAVAALRAVEQVRQVAADLRTGREGVVRLGVGRAFDAHVHELLAVRVPGIQVDPMRMTRAERLSRVRSGELDAAIVRDAGPLEAFDSTLLWTDDVLVALPATHPAAAGDVVRVSELTGLELRMAARKANPPFHDLITGTCRNVGLAPREGREITTIQSALHDIGGGEAAWTAFYPLAEPSDVPGVALRRLDGVTFSAFLITRPGDRSPAVDRLLAQLRS